MKSFLVTFEFEFPCIADNEDEARQFLKQALDDSCFLEEDCCVVLLKPGHYPDGWNKGDLVYHKGNTDITIEDAFRYKKSGP